jgi:signal transduction histidine kinase
LGSFKGIISGYKDFLINAIIERKEGAFLNIAYCEHSDTNFLQLEDSFREIEQCSLFVFKEFHDYTTYVESSDHDIDLCLIPLDNQNKKHDYLSFDYGKVTPFFIVDDDAEIDVYINDYGRGENHFIRAPELKKDLNTLLFKLTLCRYKLTRSESGQSEKQKRMNLLGEATAGVTHEINNLLQGLGLSLDLAIKKNLEGKDINFLLTGLKKLTTRGQSVTRKILNFSRSNEDKSFKVFNVTNFFENLVPILRVTLNENIILNFNNMKFDYNIIGDESQLTFVMMNIIKNAEYALLRNDNDMKIDLSLSICEKSNSLNIEIRDNGEGISEENLKKIFLPLFTTKEYGSGTGLGMSYVHSIVSLHAGEINIDSTLDLGTSIRITLPLTQEECEEPLNDNKSINYERKRFLIVDDQEEICDVLKMIIEDEGHDVADFYCPVAALEYFEKFYNIIDVVICDYHMPKMKGHELISKMKSINDLVMFIISTGDTSLIVDVGNTKILEKPYDCDELLELVFNDD